VIGLKLYVNIDGGSRGNPGQAASAMVIADETGRVLATKSKYLGDGVTNNYAEWSALAGAVKALLHLAGQYGPIEAEVRSDSKLVVQQFRREWKMKDADLSEIARGVWGDLAQNKDLSIKVRHVPRTENKLADAAVNRELDRR